MNYDFVFAVAFENIRTNLRMASLKFMISSFTDIVEKPGSSSESGIKSDHFRHQSRQKCNLDAMSQNILGVTGPEV